MSSATKSWRRRVRNLPLIGPLAVRLRRALVAREFAGVERYWESRYASGGNSGAGSYNRLAAFKAEVINDFVERNGVEMVIEFGCGDGNQLKLACYKRYLGFDVAPSAIAACKRAFAGDPTKRFKLVSEYAGEKADVSLSLDVIYHLVEQPVFEAYMRRLFDSAEKFVLIYSSNDEKLNQTIGGGPHVRHRRFSNWIERNAPDWALLSHIPNRYPFSPRDPAQTSFAEFYVYENRRRRSAAPAAP